MTERKATILKNHIGLSNIIFLDISTKWCENGRVKKNSTKEDSRNYFSISDIIELYGLISMFAFFKWASTSSVTFELSINNLAPSISTIKYAYTTGECGISLPLFKKKVKSYSHWLNHQQRKAEEATKSMSNEINEQLMLDLNSLNNILNEGLQGYVIVYK